MAEGRLSGKVVIVTGASRGLGQYCAVGYGHEGATVVVAARTDEERNPNLPGTIHATARLVEEAGGGTGRQRPWRATAMVTVVPEFTDNPEFAAASGFFWSKVAERYFEFMMSWLEASASEPAEWQQAAQFGDEFIYLTAAELTALGEQMKALIGPYLDRQPSPELRPPGARLVGYLPIALPVVNRGRRQDWPAPGSDAR